jgi:hypothetical protein
VALNRKLRNAKGDAGDFLRAVRKQKPNQWQGIYIVSPGGTVLANQASHKDPKRWAEELLEVMARGLRAYGKVTPRRVRAVDPLPFRGVGVRKDGSVTLALYTRHMHLGTRREGLGPVVIDSVTLTAKEWAALAPPRAVEGAQWTVPADIARKFNGMLSPGSDQANLPRPADVKVARLAGKIQVVRHGIGYLSFIGRLEGTKTYKYKPHTGKLVHGSNRFIGVGAYDMKRRRLLSITLVGQGVFRNFPPYDKPAAFGAVVEWRDRPTR